MFGKRLIVLLAFSAAFFTPFAARAALWDWVPRVIPTQDFSGISDPSRYPGYACKATNTWGDCVLYTYTTPNTPMGGRNLYRTVTSFGDNLNYSGCQFNDYKRDTARRTRPATCDYGTVRAY